MIPVENGCVVAPSKVKLLKLVASFAWQCSTGDTRLSALVKAHRDQHSVAVIGQMYRTGVSIEISVLKVWIALTFYIELAKINPHLVLSGTTNSIRPILRTMLRSVAEILRRCCKFKG